MLDFVLWILASFAEPLLSPSIPPLPNTSVPWPPRPTIQLAFVAADGAALRRLAPASLRREAARWLRTALQRGDGGCGGAWRVRTAGVVSTSPRVATNPLTAVVDLRQSSACDCGDPVVGGATAGVDRAGRRRLRQPALGRLEGWRLGERPARARREQANRKQNKTTQLNKNNTIIIVHCHFYLNL